jgi:hypothetical protein
MSKTMGLLHPLKAVRRAGVPLVAYETPDPAATIAGCIAALNGRKKGEEDWPMISWDIVRGLIGLNKPGQEAIGWYDPLAMQLPEILKGLQDVPGGSIVFLHQITRFFERDGVLQGLWLLRDAFKGKQPRAATCVMLGASFKLPAELQHDVVIISEPLPDETGLAEITDRLQRHQCTHRQA